MIFKPGQVVKYVGLTVGEIVTRPVEGKLILCDSNLSVKGVMRIQGDEQGMLFTPDGKIYCHPQYGRLLKRKRKSKLPKDSWA